MMYLKYKYCKIRERVRNVPTIGPDLATNTSGSIPVISFSVNDSQFVERVMSYQI